MAVQAQQQELPQQDSLPQQHTLPQQDGDYSYDRSFGLRLSLFKKYDFVTGSYKTFISPQAALEFNAGFGNFRGYSDIVVRYFAVTTFSATAAYQYHIDLDITPGLKWFVGGGVLLFGSSSKYEYYSGMGLGLFGNGGFDYKFKNLPLNLSLDARPTVNLIKPELFSRFTLHNIGLAARYTF